MKDIIENINSKEDFIKFMSWLIDDFKNEPTTWENTTLLDYLMAIQNWTEDMEGFYINNKTDIPRDVNWKVFAHILRAATIYE